VLRKPRATTPVVEIDYRTPYGRSNDGSRVQ